MQTVNTLKVSNLIAVTDTMAGDLAGATSYWQLHGGVNAYDMREAGVSAGISVDNLPQDTSYKAALRRACADQTNKRTLARSLPGGGWAIVDEKAEKGSLTHGVIVKCFIDNGRPEYLDEVGPVFPDQAGSTAQRAAFAVEVAYHTHLAQLDASDVSGWLVASAERIGGVALRDRGGVYFIPRHALNEWRTIAAVLRSVAPTCEVYELPTMHSSEAVRSIVAAVTREASMLSEDLLGKLAEGVLGERALKARQGDCEALCVKLEAYEALLGTTLDDVKAQIGTVAAACGAAALLIEAQADAASGA